MWLAETKPAGTPATGSRPSTWRLRATRCSSASPKRPATRKRPRSPDRIARKKRRWRGASPRSGTRSSISRSKRKASAFPNPVEHGGSRSPQRQNRPLTAQPERQAASEVTLEVGRRTLRLTRLEQRWWPTQEVRKRDVIGYYDAVASVLLPHLTRRPFTIKRHFNGPRSPFIWIKDAPPELPDWIPISAQPAKSRAGAAVRYPLVQNEAALLWMIEYGCIDLHVWPSRRDLPDRPDYVLFDLDPHRAPFRHVVEAAHLVHDALE